jgi:hypothetical protein
MHFLGCAIAALSLPNCIFYNRMPNIQKCIVRPSLFIIIRVFKYTRTFFYLISYYSDKLAASNISVSYNSYFNHESATLIPSPASKFF